MGFECVVETGKFTKVIVNHTHSDYAVTTAEGNPYKSTITYGAVKIKNIGIFKRTYNKSRKPSVGDNCPMLYALKNMNNLRTNFRSVYLLYIEFLKIVDLILTEECNHWDVIIILPSSSLLTKRFAERLAKKMTIQMPDIFLLEPFKKVTFEDVNSDLNYLKVNNLIKSQAQTNIRQDIKKFIKKNNIPLGSSFQMKAIDKKYRHHIKPFKLKDLNEDIMLKLSECKKILLVDDMLNSGTSIISARSLLADLLSKDIKNIEIGSMTLFSKTKGIRQ